METIEIDMTDVVNFFDRNWFGMEKHPTDAHIDWNLSHDDAKKEALVLRNAYNQIKQHGLLKELNILIKASKYNY